MKRVLAAIVLLGVALSSSSRNKEEIRIARIDSLNAVPESIDSHRGEEMRSSLEPMAASMQLIPPSALGCKNPVYARIKKLANGNYFLMYHNGRIGSSVWYNISPDLVNWSEPQFVFKARPTTTPAGEDQWRYSSADAIVLNNGDLLAFVALRANKGYRYYPECNHVAMRRSTDNGLTWGEEEFIYDGTVWEPYMLQLPSGKIQCYFTDTEPQKLNSGTSIVESEDNGYTWKPGGLSNCYKVIRQYKYTDEGTDIYTDQMPCVKMLNDGHTLLGFVESRLGPKPEKDAVYKMTIVRGRDEWKHLGPGETGPEDREDNVISGAAGYVGQFPSGETVLSCNLNQIFQLKIGDCTGKVFQGEGWDDKWMKAFPEKGFWGCVELDADHVMLGTIHCKTGIQLGGFYLNHRIDAGQAKIRVDGDNRDWPASHAWFIGSDNPAVQTSVRAARSGKNLCFVFDRLDNAVEEGDDIEIRLSGGDSLKEGDVTLRITSSGTMSVERFDGTTWQSCKVPRGAKSAVARVQEGYVSEISLPVSVLPKNVSEDGCYRVMVSVLNGTAEDSFTWAEASDPSSWQLLRIK